MKTCDSAPRPNDATAVSTRKPDPPDSSDFQKVERVSIETITACNMRCSYCPNSIYDRSLMKNKRLMPTELFHKIIDELADLGFVGEIPPHAYGEPLLDERMPDLVAYIKQRLPETTVNLFSNGELLTVPLYRKLVGAGVGIFTVTQHRKEESPNVLAVLDWRAKHGDDNVAFLYRPLRRISTRGGLIPIAYRVSRPKRCGWPSGNIDIAYNGDLRLCCQDYFANLNIGNVAENRLIDVWNDPAYRKLRQDLDAGRLYLEICRKCERGVAEMPGLWERIGFHLPTLKSSIVWLLRKFRNRPSSSH